MQKVGQIHELLTGLVGGLYPLKIQGLATFGDLASILGGSSTVVPDGDSPQASQASMGSSTPLIQVLEAPQPPIRLSSFTGKPSAPPGLPQPPVYALMELFTVPDLWREWEYGIGGNLPVRLLEEKWGHHWRISTASKVAFCRRKVILDEVKRLIRLGTPEEVAVEQVEALRDGKSLNKLRNSIKARSGSQMDRKRKRSQTEGT